MFVVCFIGQIEGGVPEKGHLLFYSRFMGFKKQGGITAEPGAGRTDHALYGGSRDIEASLENQDRPFYLRRDYSSRRVTMVHVGLEMIR